MLGRDLKESNKGNQAVRSGFAPGREPRREGSAPVWEETLSQAALGSTEPTQPLPPTPGLPDKAEKTQKFSFTRQLQFPQAWLPGCETAGQPGPQAPQETRRTGGGAVGGSQEAPRCSELDSRNISRLWPDQKGPYHELHNSTSSAVHGQQG